MNDTTPPLIDEERMALLLDALGKEKLAELCATAARSIKETFDELDERASNGDFATAGKHAHRLVGAAANFAMPALAAAARRVEADCRQGGDGRQGLAALADLVARSLDALASSGSVPPADV